ncbi:MAG: SDR family NAD(P)-dependent oxidoreductase [Alphaproteobacteria bacterium]|jgi:NAD(P)-dependent dehydrogenase (short-subunit alcohol dehydrogenase family)
MTVDTPLAGRTALIAGASRGLGAAAAEALAAAGATVIIVARTQGGLEALHDRIKAAGGTAVIAPVDLTDDDAVDQLALGVAERFGKLDILVQTAAILGVLSPIAHVKPDVFAKVVATNLTAHWRIIRNFEALLKRSDAGRAIIATSGAAAGGLAYWAPYAASKAALEAMVSCWAEEVRKTSLKVNLLDPGVMATDLRAEAFPGEATENLTTPEAIAPMVVQLALPECTIHGQVMRAG